MGFPKGTQRCRTPMPSKDGASCRAAWMGRACARGHKGQRANPKGA